MNIRDMMPFRKNPMRNFGGMGLNYWPEMHDRMNDVMETFFSNVPALSETATSLMMPLLNVSENDKGVKIKVELPGLNENDVKIESRNNQVIIKGERKEEKEEKDANFYVRECSSGKFLRTVTLPFEVDINKTLATFKNGILDISIERPKEAITGTKSIPIKSGK